MGEIRGDAKTIRQLLGGAKYAIDYYQREFKWKTKHIAELIEDLTNKFLEKYEPSDPRNAVAKYSHYFLGSIIISDKGGKKYIIDGQQRLTTLTLLLIYIQHLLKDSEQKGLIADLIYSQKYGKKSFNLDVPERTTCMEALYSGEAFDENNHPESVRNIFARYKDIEERMPEEVQGETLPYFVDWLIENVHLVEITAYSDEDAYTIFETMNDRGLSLSPTDMLKGYLLANIVDETQRTSASQVWKNRLNPLNELGKDEDADCIKSWLRSQYAESIRERKRGAAPKDFDLLGTEYHRWVREHEDELELKKSDDFVRLIKHDFAFYSNWYLQLRKASETIVPKLECIYFNAQNNFTLQFPVLLASLRVDDSESNITRKIKIASSFIDILIHRRIWNWRSISYSTMQYAMFVVMKEIRGVDVAALADILRKRLDGEQELFASNDRFQLHGMNGRPIHLMLARLTDYVEINSGMPSRYTEYVQRGKMRYEIEHIWADHPEQHMDDFNHSNDFQEYRNRFGGLLLLPRNFNESYGDLPYKDKLNHYFSQNLLARSLNEKAYDHNPGFIRFIKETGLPFEPHNEFKKADLDGRQALYRMLAEKIWSPDRINKEIEE